MISIICCYNNKDVLNQMLKKSIEKQDLPYEIIEIDNRNFKFTSAASALNYGASLAKGDYYVFVHQDIQLYWENSLSIVVEYIKKYKNCIIGIAGRDVYGIHSNITHGPRNMYAGNIKVTEPVEVDTLDECLFAMSKDVFNEIRFDEITCDDWHLYSVDMCLSGKEKNIKSIVIPLEAYHGSAGALTNGYWKTMDKVIKKHKRNHTKILTTCSVVHTSFLKNRIFKVLRGTKHILLKTYKYVKYKPIS